MKIKELMNRLSKFDPDATVYVETDTIDHFSIEDVCKCGTGIFLDCKNVRW